MKILISYFIRVYSGIFLFLGGFLENSGSCYDTFSLKLDINLKAVLIWKRAIIILSKIYLPSVTPKVRLSRLWIENFDLELLTPVVKFLTPGRKVWAITALTYSFLKNMLII